VAAAELAHGFVERFGPLEIAAVTGVGNNDELRVRDGLLELACDAERGARVELAQISSVGTAILGSRSRWSASAITNSWALRVSGRPSAAISSSRGTNSVGGSPANSLGRVGSNSSAGAASIWRAPATRACTSSSDSDPFQPA